MSAITLHNYFRSSTSYRVRIALNMKGLSYDYVPYNLREGQQTSERFLEFNPQGLVPAMQADNEVFTQSHAIIEYLEETYPEPALLPKDASSRARVRAICFTVACDIHPLNNLRILKELGSTFNADEDAVKAWFHKWVHAAFGPLEKMLSTDKDTGTFCHGDTPGMADIYIASQCTNNKRFDVDMSPYPTISRINEACMQLDAFKNSHSH